MSNQILVKVTTFIVINIFIYFMASYEASNIAAVKANNIVLNEAIHLKNGIRSYQKIRGEFCPSVDELYSNAFIRSSQFSSLGLTRNKEDYTTTEIEGECIVNIPLPSEENVKAELNVVLSALATIPRTLKKDICLEILSYGLGHCNNEKSYEFSLKNRLIS